MFPNLVLLSGAPTPIERCDALAEAIGLRRGQLQIKRDDLTKLGVGGNKARKLDYLVADAVERGATTLVTGGAVQSNHVRMTAAAAAVSGLDCVAVLGGQSASVVEGNTLLDVLFGAELVFTGDDYSDDLEVAIEQVAAEREGAYAIPLGGSNAIGALGYVQAADELSNEVPTDALIVHAEGSGGTHAGLVAGFGDHGRVMAVDVGAVRDIANKVTDLAIETAELAGRPKPTGLVQVLDGQVGERYGAPTDAARSAISLVARTAGIVLDPVYSGKAFAGLIQMAASGDLADRPVVFVHTGGLPAIFTRRFSNWLVED
ncbi:MAG: D-cysteine desulfhydrase family protein [Actinobacteria bacterium]|nr:D-cysteine desulfhydrase family protein [Actinomycetota bacterium]